MAQTRTEAAAYPTDSTGPMDRELQSDLAEILDRELDTLAQQLASFQPPADALPPKALVDEAILRLLHDGRRRWKDRAHFVASGRRAMRNAWIDHLRRTGRLKRGRRDAFVSVDEAILPSKEPVVDRVVLEESLRRFTAVDPLVAKAVEFESLFGFTRKETARALHVSRATLARRRIAAIGVLRGELADEWTRVSGTRPALRLAEAPDESDLEWDFPADESERRA